MYEEGDTQISITWNDQDQKRVEEDYCEGCKTKNLRLMIGGLVEKLVGNQVIEKPVVVVKKKPLVVERPVVVVEEKEKEKGKGVLYGRYVNGNWGWYKSGNEKKDEKYVGEIENGVPYGQGTYTYPDGRKYVGEFKDGKRNVKGSYTYPNGRKYVGEFKGGLPNGQGTETFSDGNKYVGGYKNGGEHGQGTYTWFPFSELEEPILYQNLGGFTRMWGFYLEGV